MKKFILLQTFLLMQIWLFAQFDSKKYNTPKTKKIEKVTILHNDTTIDYYDWFRNKEDADVLNYLYAENAYCDRVMQSQSLLIKNLYESMRNRMDETKKSKETKIKNYLYYTKTEKNKEYATYYRRKDTLNAKEEIILDLNEIATQYKSVALSLLQFSPNQKLLAYGLNSLGGDAAHVFIKNLETNELYSSEIDNVQGLVWCSDNETILYVKDENNRANKVYKHNISENTNKDVLIYTEKDKGMNINIGITISEEYILLYRNNFTGNEIYYTKANKPENFILFEPFENGIEYDINHYPKEDYFYIETNRNAPDGKFAKTPINKTQHQYWEDVISSATNTSISSNCVFRNFYLYSATENGLTNIFIKNRKTQDIKKINLEKDFYSAFISKFPGYDSLWFHYSISTLNEPIKEYRYNLLNDSITFIGEDTVKDYNPKEYTCKRIWVTAYDSVKIPMDLLYKKNLKINGENPVYATAYACYGSNLPFGFSKQYIPLIERNFIIAILHPRGESILGKQWHNTGKLLYKKNTYRDVISCVEYLINEKYTKAGKIAIQGGSAGGMLVGTVITMRPELFGAAIADVPFVDVLNQMQDTTWANIIPHFDEIGNPFNKEQYFYLKDWCPYQNTKAINYPSILITAGYNDSRVPYWSPVKWAAKLRELKQDSNVLLLKTNLNSGHFGQSGRYAGLKDEALKFAFVMQALGINENYIEVTGKVLDENKNVLPFVTVYLKGTTYGTTTNFEGEFKLDIKDGQPNELVFQCVGFEQQILKFDLNVQTTDITIILKNQDVYLNEVTVKANSKDPAYGIIEKVQDKRKYFLNSVKSYSTDIYMKSSQKLNEIPEKLPTWMKLAMGEGDTLKTGLLYVSESVTRYHRKKPDYYKEEMLASKESGQAQGYSFNRAEEVLINFYENHIPMGFSERQFISPIASNSFFYYKYRLINSFQEDGKKIYKISVIPKRKMDLVFKGDIYIVENEWCIHSLNLTITKDAQIDLIDSINIKQSYVPVSDSLWMPLSLTATTFIKVFGFGVTGSSLGFFSNYIVNPEFKEDFFGNEIFKIEKDANKKDSAFWINSRPLVLTNEEEKVYFKGDSLLKKRESKEYRDSILKKSNKFNWKYFPLSGYTYRNQFKKTRINISGPMTYYDFNTVEGSVFNFTGSFNKINDESLFWMEKYSFDLNTRYSITNQKLYGKIEYKLTTDYKKYRTIKIKAGSIAQQYYDDAISPFLNTVYTLFYETNYAKLYENNFLKIEYNEILNPLIQIRGSVEYAMRKPLKNNSSFTIIKYDREYQTNHPLNFSSENNIFEKHNALCIELGVNLFFKRKYESYPDIRFYSNAKYPVVQLYYKKGLAFAGSNVNFDYLELSVYQTIDMINFGKSAFRFSVGSFLNTKSISFVDYKHFKGNKTHFLRTGQNQLSFLTAFNSLDYYKNSTTKTFFEGHYEHHFNGWIVNKLPFIRKTKFQEVCGINMLYTQNEKEYIEVFAGAENIFKIFRIDLASKYIHNQKLKPEIRLGLSIHL